MFVPIRASISIPGLLNPVKYKNKILTDGANSNPIPIQPLKQNGVKKIIAVSLYPKIINNIKNPSILDILISTSNLLERKLIVDRQRDR